MSNKSFYQNSKVYKIVCDTTNKFYIGSTTKKLCQRIAQHRSNYKMYKKGNYHYVSSFEVLEADNYNIILLEEVECENKEQLLQRERHYIELFPECINKERRPITTNDERIERKQLSGKKYREEHKEYYIKYKEDNKEKIKEYYTNNRSKILESSKEYREKNKDALTIYHRKYNDINKEKKKDYYEKNRETINEKQRADAKIKMVCECGITYTKHNRSRHMRTIKHCQYIESLNEPKAQST
jgi:hypothetical protein